MTEKSITGALLHKFRGQYPNATVIKHHDAGRKGVPDFSVTLEGHTLWVEVKLYRPPRNWDESIPYAKIAQESPVQYCTCKKLAQEGNLIYLFIVPHHAEMTFWRPLGHSPDGLKAETYRTVDPVTDLYKLLKDKLPI